MIRIVIALTFFNLSYALNLQDKLDAKKNSGEMTPERAKIKKIFKAATNELKDSGLEKKALKKSVKAPDVLIGEKKLSEYLKEGPVILKFYRGHWCPYCMIELQEYQSYLQKFKAKKATLIGLVPDLKKYIDKTKKKFNLTFPIYRDANHRIAKKFGLTFRVREDVVGIYKKFDIDLEKSQGNTRNELAMPGTYVINQNGDVVYAFYDADYTKRADPEEVLAALK